MFGVAILHTTWGHTLHVTVMYRLWNSRTHCSSARTAYRVDGTLLARAYHTIPWHFLWFLYSIPCAFQLYPLLQVLAPRLLSPSTSPLASAASRSRTTLIPCINWRNVVTAKPKVCSPICLLWAWWSQCVIVRNFTHYTHFLCFYGRGDILRSTKFYGFIFVFSFEKCIFIGLDGSLARRFVFPFSLLWCVVCNCSQCASSHNANVSMSLNEHSDA